MTDIVSFEQPPYLVVIEHEIHVVDETPQPTFVVMERHSGVTSIHGNLAGLTADDHLQYLPVNGTRAMTGALLFSADNIHDIGAAGATRPRTGYFGTSVVTPLVGTGAASNLSFTTSGGTQVRIDHVASAVNFLTLKGAVTVDNVVLSVDGETDVALKIATKANGNLWLEPNAADIRWGKALVALGGGAAPTFGTIGGSGPATAAQNTWMRALDSAGDAFWVPAWK